MSISILQSSRENSEARQEMNRRGISSLKSSFSLRLRSLLRLPADYPCDPMKSWDVLNTICLIENMVPRDGPVLDLGAYRSEILPALHCIGYSDLCGIDLNPRITKCLYSEKIRYAAEDFYHTNFGDRTFQAVTAISSIEHGLDLDLLLKEVSRILAPGGLFVGSTDYWPEKIDCSDDHLFHLTWKIFDKKELIEFVTQAERYGLELFGTPKYEAKDQVVSYRGKQYTFAWFAFRRRFE
jgi:SAM-dependent methyltransferase